MRSLERAALAALGLASIVGCNKPDRPGPGQQEGEPGSTAVTGAQYGIVTNDSAASGIVTAQCAREAKCGHVGASKPFASGDDCTDRARAAMHGHLTERECPNGIDPKALDECLVAIEKEDCARPLDTASRLSACTPGQLCIKTREPYR